MSLSGLLTFISLNLLVLHLRLVHNQACPPRTLKIFLHGVRADWYFNGTRVAQNIDPNGLYTFPAMPAGATRVAVMMTNYNKWGGLLASTTDGTFLSTTQWKCTDKPALVPADWASHSFNSANWPWAIGCCPNAQGPLLPSGWGVLTDISQNAQWIWISNLPSASTAPIHCTVDAPAKVCQPPVTIAPTTTPTPKPSTTTAPEIVPEGCQVRKFTIYQHNVRSDWYFDGQRVAQNIDPNGVYTFSHMPPKTSKIAVRMTNYGPYGGLLGSSADGNVLTNNTAWKCTTEIHPGDWTGLKFDDNHWAPAHQCCGNINSQTLPAGWPVVPEINSTAKWIWTTPLPTNSNTTVYCRGNVTPKKAQRSFGIVSVPTMSIWSILLSVAVAGIFSRSATTTSS